MSLNLPRVYPITDTTICSLTHAEQVDRLLAGGATLIQLREKKGSARTFFEDATVALRHARQAGTTTIINDRVDIALALGADGVHLGQWDMPVPAARQLLGPDAIIGYSTHNLDQVRAALELPIDYLAFGPVFETRTKKDPDPTAGLDALHQAKLLAGRIPLVAIGGIQRRNLNDVLANGADAAAMISEILTPAENIPGNLGELLSLATSQRG